MGEAGRTFVHDNYSMNAVTEQWLSIYEELRPPLAAAA